ncbi:hypothetical protein Ccrd_011262, partial [Cynara cardunculus var. scolymus]
MGYQYMNQFVFRKSESPTMSNHGGYMKLNIYIRMMLSAIYPIVFFITFCPTKEVVKTSILSTRWKNLWDSVPNFDFDDALLYATMLVRDASNIEKFCLSCRVCFNASQIHSWIYDAIVHNIQELDLCLFAEDPSVIPRSMFDSKSLVSLKIEMNCVVELPSRISFPRLRILHLSLVTFPNDDSTEKLLGLSCSRRIDCEWVNLKNIAISNSTLKNLSIDDMPYFGPLDDHCGSKIKIDATNLTFLEYIAYLSNEIFLDDVSSLVKACIHIPNPQERQKEVVCRTVDILKGLRYVESLRYARVLESMDIQCCKSQLLDLKKQRDRGLSLRQAIALTHDECGTDQAYIKDNHSPHMKKKKERKRNLMTEGETATEIRGNTVGSEEIRAAGRPETATGRATGDGNRKSDDRGGGRRRPTIVGVGGDVKGVLYRRGCASPATRGWGRVFERRWRRWGR